MTFNQELSDNEGRKYKISGKKELIYLKNSDDISWEEILETQDYVVPLVDIFENDQSYVMITNIPGVKRENIRVKIKGDSFLIFGKINYEDRKQRKYILNETEIGNYYRVFKISKSIDKSKIEAMYENGQLIVKLPKNEKMKQKNIEVN